MALVFENCVFEIPDIERRIQIQGVVGDAETVLITGPTGCGKTSFFKAICGFIPWQSGKFWVDQKIQNNLAPHQIRAGYVSQVPGIWPDISVEKNILAGLNFHPIMQHLSLDQKKQRLGLICETWGAADILSKDTGSLSGGEKQIVAFLRTLLNEPPFYLIDEGWSAIDPQRRKVFMGLFKEVILKRPVPVLWTSHHPEELLTIANRTVSWDIEKSCLNF